MKFKKIEVAIAVVLIMLLTLCFIPVRTQANLADKLTRLHIIANSDSECDQTLKLAVRDAVLGVIDERDESITDDLIARIRRTAQDEVYKRGFDYIVNVERCTMYFDTRHYDGFSLPAGEYGAVRVTIGEAQGKNWWCVLFPPLCAGVAEGELDEVAQRAGLTDEELAFIKGDGTVVIVKFKLAELWGKLVELLR